MGETKMFPEIKPYDTGFLPQEGLHRVYYEEYGNPQGAPLILLHGGPGGAILGDKVEAAQMYDPEVYLPACRAWAAYETSFFKLIPDPEAVAAGQEEIFAVPYARMNIHFFSNDCVLREKPILDNIARIRHIPCTIVHGRYDLSVPVRLAAELKDALPDAELVITPDAGHSGSDGSNVTACIEAQEKLKRVF